MPFMYDKAWKVVHDERIPAIANSLLFQVGQATARSCPPSRVPACLLRLRPPAMLQGVANDLRGQ